MNGLEVGGFAAEGGSVVDQLDRQFPGATAATEVMSRCRSSPKCAVKGSVFSITMALCGFTGSHGRVGLLLVCRGISGSRGVFGPLFDQSGI